MKIIDAHTHYGKLYDMPFMNATFEEVLEVEREAGVTANIFLGRNEAFADPNERDGRRNLNIDMILKINEEVLKNVAKEKDCYMCCVFNPRHKESYRQVEEFMKEKKCIGVKMGPNYHGYGIDEVADDIFPFLIEKQIPVTFHSMQNGKDNPERIASYAAKYPEAKIIMAHLFYSNPITVHADLVRMCKSENLYVGLEGPKMAYYGIIEYAIKICGSEKIIFGSDMPCHHPSPLIAAIQCAKIAQRDKENIFYRNAKRFYGIKG